MGLAPQDRMRYCTYILALACCVACSRESKKAGSETSGTKAASGELAMPADTTPPKNLDGTRWRLVEIQSTGGAQSATRPDDPNKYTISFDSEGGFLSMQIDCNRASANYEHKRNADRLGGTMKVEPLKITRAQCPANSLADRLATDIEKAQGYRFANGRLMLTTPNGAVYVWDRQR